MSGSPQRYLLALGSNMRHPRYGAPSAILRAAARELTKRGVNVTALSPVYATAPLGPSRRRFANAAALVVTSLGPASMLAEVKQVERAFGRRRAPRWAARVLDIDLVLWSGGRWRSPSLTIPHPEFRRRAFVLRPAVRIAPRWRDPLTGHNIAHLAARLTRPRPVPRPSLTGP